MHLRSEPFGDNDGIGFIARRIVRSRGTAFLAQRRHRAVKCPRLVGPKRGSLSVRGRLRCSTARIARRRSDCHGPFPPYRARPQAQADATARAPPASPARN